MEPVIARKCWRSLEMYHGLVYFAPEAAEAYAALGITGFDGYFASRAAPMGAVPAEVVIATFFNFNPAIVRRAVPAVWEKAAPSAILEARLAAADGSLRRAVGDALDPVVVQEAAAIARKAAEACGPSGRPLFAGHASLPWPDEPHLALWHAISMLREYRGDGHIACLTEAGIDGCEALVLHAASGEVPRPILQTTRDWPDDEWDAAVGRLASRGIVDDGGVFTDAGRTLRQGIEDRTDELALPPWQAIGEVDAQRLRQLVRPMSSAIMASGGLSFPQ